jgi:hypothetical protein
MKWTTKQTDLSDTKVSRRICVGNCTVNIRSHFAKPSGFIKHSWAVDKNNSLWFKGKCAGWDLLRNEPKKEEIELDDVKLVGISDWTDLDETSVVPESARMEKFRLLLVERLRLHNAEVTRRSAARTARRSRGWNAGKNQTHPNPVRDGDASPSP